MNKESYTSVVLSLFAILIFTTVNFAQESQDHEKTPEEWEAEEAALGQY